jgi:hypothetical protein
MRGEVKRLASGLNAPFVQKHQHRKDVDHNREHEYLVQFGEKGVRHRHIFRVVIYTEAAAHGQPRKPTQTSPAPSKNRTHEGV